MAKKTGRGAGRKGTQRSPLPLLFGVLVVVIVIWWLALSRQSVLQPSGTTPGTAPGATPGKTPTVQVGQEVKAELYYVNKGYIQLGKEELAGLVPVQRVLRYNKGTEEEAIARALRENPENPKLTTALRKDLAINSVRVKGKVAVVDFSDQNLYGGSLEETLVLQQLVYTLTGRPGIEKVQFLVNGEKRETLMGHVTIIEPLGRKDF